VGQGKSDRRMLWLQLEGLKWETAPSKGVNTDTVPVVDPVFSGGFDHARRAGNRGNLGRAIPWTHLFLKIRLCRPQASGL
jgi:hypothetical protein